VTKVGREVPAVELHALDHVERRLERLGLLDRDDAVLADLLHGLGDDRADGLVAVAEIMPTCATMLPDTAGPSS